VVELVSQSVGGVDPFFRLPSPPSVPLRPTPSVA